MVDLFSDKKLKNIQHRQNKTAVFTIVSLNYGAFAKTLMQSLQETHPDWDRHVLLVDRCPIASEFGGALFETTLVESLALPKMNEFLFRYGIMELNTAAKPYMFTHLRQLGYEHIIYIDPDILVLDRLIDVEQRLNEGATGVLTPHLTAPLRDARTPSELDIMRAGAYNLGFLALGNTQQANAFIQWWEEKLEYGAVSDPARGLFTDQKWVDLAPGMFQGFSILHNPGYNVAYWNLPHRPVVELDGKWFAGGEPLRFFHFSGFDPLNPKPFSKHQDRLTLESIGDAKKLALLYAGKVKNNGLVEYRTQAYAFGSLCDGTSIPSAIRYLYREDESVRFQAGENPFDAAHFFLDGEAGELPVILRAVWLEHAHLQRAFPDPLHTSRLAFYHWFADKGAIDIGIPEAYVFPIRRELRKIHEQIQKEREPVKLISEMPGYKPSVWARGLVFLHKRVTGGSIGHARLTQYQQVTSFSEFIRLGFAQFRGTRWAERLGIGAPTRARMDPLRSGFAHQKHVTDAHVFSRRRNTLQFSGLYIEDGQEAWWMGKQARFLIKSARTNVLVLELEIYQELLQRAFGKSDMSLSIGFNDYPRQDVFVNGDVSTYSLNIEHMPEQWPAVLHMTPSDSFVPKDIGLNNDSRHLSIRLRSLTMGGERVFCTANDKGPSLKNSGDTPGVNVIGYARSEHGVGQSLRQFTTALDAIDVPHVVIDFNKNNLSRLDDQSMEKKMEDEPRFGISVFHINADQMPEAEMHLPSHWLTRYNIGFWHWELPDMLPEHLAGFSHLNEVWVPTGFVQEAVSKLSPVPVVRMPHAIQFSISENASRDAFHLPSDKFLFLVMYDFSSYQERKNPKAAIDAFRRAFDGASDSVGLVIKTQNAQHHPKDVKILRDHLAGKENIYWINETLDRQAVYDLQSVCDCYVSLHRAEGYGLGPAESMYLGKPVIATNWSGNTEFMRQDNSLPVNYKLMTIERDIGVYKAGQVWADPDIDHAAQLMQQIARDAVFHERISIAAKRTMREEYSPERVGERIARRLRYIQHEIIDVSTVRN